MTLVELATTVLLTYASSEYFYGSQWRAIYGVWGVIIVQLLEAVARLHLGLHLPGIPLSLWPIKVVLVAATFVGVLWLDCSRTRRPKLDEFVSELGRAFLYLLPVFPWVAIAISVGFLMLISFFEFVGFSTKVRL